MIGIKRKNAKLLAIVITSIVINANGTGTATDFNNQDNQPMIAACH